MNRCGVTSLCSANRLMIRARSCMYLCSILYKPNIPGQYSTPTRDVKVQQHLIAVWTFSSNSYGHQFSSQVGHSTLCGHRLAVPGAASRPAQLQLHSHLSHQQWLLQPDFWQAPPCPLTPATHRGPQHLFNRIPMEAPMLLSTISAHFKSIKQHGCGRSTAELSLMDNNAARGHPAGDARAARHLCSPRTWFTVEGICALCQAPRSK